jgi:hypothetical protein
MDYFKHYERLIQKRKRAILEKRMHFESLYTESHHIFPICKGGPDVSENKVRLTAREHFLAHLLLVKMYPEHQGLLYAANWMSNNKKYGSRKYTWLKEKFSILNSEKKKGISLSEDHCNNISNSLKGYKKSNEHLKRIGESKKDIPLSDEHRQKLSKDIPISYERHEKMFGRIFSKESLEKMSKAKKGIPKEKSTICPYCHKIGDKANMIRWHFEKCKKKKMPC